MAAADVPDLISFESDMTESLEAARILGILAQRVEDPGFAQEIANLLQAYNVQNMPN